MAFDRGWLLAWIFDVPNNPKIWHSKPCFVDFSKFVSFQGPLAVELWHINLLVLSRPCSHSVRFLNCHTGIQMKSDVFEGPWSVKMADVLRVSGTWRTVGRTGVASSQGSRRPFEKRSHSQEDLFWLKVLYCTVPYVMCDGLNMNSYMFCKTEPFSAYTWGTVPTRRSFLVGPKTCRKGNLGTSFLLNKKKVATGQMGICKWTIGSCTDNLNFKDWEYFECNTCCPGI